MFVIMAFTLREYVLYISIPEWIRPTYMTKLTRSGHADLHIHTSASDGKPNVHELLQFIAEQRPGLDVIAITDHDTLEASLWAYAHRDRYPFQIVPGVEVTSLAGHILALWVQTPIPAYMDLTDTVAAIHEAGGISILAHPFHLEFDESRRNALRYWRDPSVLSRAGLDAIETYNAGVVTPGSNWAASLFSRQLAIAVTGSSDAHTLGAVGRAVTRFPGRSAADLRRAIQENQTAAEGRPWPISEYVDYLQHERQRRSIPSLANTTSSQTINP